MIGFLLGEGLTWSTTRGLDATGLCGKDGPNNTRGATDHNGSKKGLSTLPHKWLVKLDIHLCQQPEASPQELWTASYTGARFVDRFSTAGDQQYAAQDTTRANYRTAAATTSRSSIMLLKQLQTDRNSASVVAAGLVEVQGDGLVLGHEALLRRALAGGVRAAGNGLDHLELTGLVGGLVLAADNIEDTVVDFTRAGLEHHSIIAVLVLVAFGLDRCCLGSAAREGQGAVVAIWCGHNGVHEGHLVVGQDVTRHVQAHAVTQGLAAGVGILLQLAVEGTHGRSGATGYHEVVCTARHDAVDLEFSAAKGHGSRQVLPGNPCVD